MFSTGVLLPVSAERNIRNIRRLLGDTPMVVGFAIRDPEQVRRYVSAGADGVVVGSGFLRILEGYPEGERVEKAIQFLRSLKEVLTEDEQSGG